MPGYFLHFASVSGKHRKFLYSSASNIHENVFEIMMGQQNSAAFKSIAFRIIRFYYAYRGLVVYMKINFQAESLRLY